MSNFPECTEDTRKYGCTDWTATNFQTDAEVDDGSCFYKCKEEVAASDEAERIANAARTTFDGVYEQYRGDYSEEAQEAKNEASKNLNNASKAASDASNALTNCLNQ